MLKLKLQYFGHLMQRTDSLEKTLMLGKIEGERSSPDIRAGIALLIAAMSANGTSHIDNIQQIDRGYEHIEERLNALGARITRSE